MSTGTDASGGPSSLPSSAMDTASATARRPSPTRTRTAGLVCLWGGVVGFVQAVVMLVVPAVVAPDRYSFPFTPGGYALAQSTFAVQHVALVVGVAVLAPMAATAVTRWALHGATAGLVLLSAMELVAITAAGSSVTDPQAELRQLPVRHPDGPRRARAAGRRVRARPGRVAVGHRRRRRLRVRRPAARDLRPVRGGPPGDRRLDAPVRRPRCAAGPGRAVTAVAAPGPADAGEAFAGSR